LPVLFVEVVGALGEPAPTVVTSKMVPRIAPVAPLTTNSATFGVQVLRLVWFARVAKPTSQFWAAIVWASSGPERY